MEDFLDKNINADEIEIKIGEFQKGKFNPYLSKEKFDFFKKLPILEEKIFEKRNYLLKVSNGKNKVYREYQNHYEIKERLGNFDLRLMNIRVSAANETITNKQNHLFKEFKKKRETFLTKDRKFRFDFTETDGKYSLEVEYFSNSISKIFDILKMIGLLYAYHLQFDFWKIVNKPISLDHQTVFYLKKGYAITEKADGSRVLLLITSNHIYEISSTSVEEIVLEKTLSCKNVPYVFFLIDCEKVNDTYYGFDIINYCYFKIDRKDLPYRYHHLKKLIKETKMEKRLKIKQMRMRYDNLVDEVKKVYQGNYNYGVDGIIFTPINGFYKDRKLPILKWKPIEDLTVDFLVKIGKEVSLYCKDNGPKLFDKVPLKTFTKEERNKMNNKIVELSFDKTWKFYRVREDKTKEYENSNEFIGPNHCMVCEKTKNLINQPLEINNLNKEVYYKNVKETHMKKMKKYNNEIKTYLIEKYVKKNDKILDIAGGRGGDLMKYRRQQVKEILLLNINEGGIAEARRRFPNNNFKSQIGDARENLKIEGEYDVVSMQFAIHYMLGSKKNWDTFFKNINKVLKEGGYFICSFLDGESVHHLLEKNNEHNFLGNNNKSSIFKLEKLYQGKLKDYGQEIKVISENFGEMNEFLVNVNFIKKYFEKKNYQLEEDKFFKEIKDLNHLSNGEKEYADLERTLVFKKK